MQAQQLTKHIMAIHWIKQHYLPVLQAEYPQLKIKQGPMWGTANIPKAIADIINAQDPNVGTSNSLIFKQPKQSKSKA
jgi:hypothetical protein